MKYYANPNPAERSGYPSNDDGASRGQDIATAAKRTAVEPATSTRERLVEAALAVEGQAQRVRNTAVGHSQRALLWSVGIAAAIGFAVGLLCSHGRSETSGSRGF
jgi:ElaB/YqjD/DUF883 family membrane-anchored ribosome-binding protein